MDFLKMTDADPQASAALGLKADASFLGEEPAAGVSTGTTVMAVAFDGGVVLGADTRTSAGAYIVNRASRKVTQLHDRIFVARSGSAADTQQISSYVKHYLSQHALELGTMPLVSTAANLFQLMCYNNKDHISAGLIIAGWDPKKGGNVISIPLGGTMIQAPYGVGGSGSTYVIGLLDSEYKPNMTRLECQAFVKKLVSHAMARDGSSGGMIRLTTVTKDGVEEEAIRGDQLPFELA